MTTDLGEFDGQQVLRTTIAVTNAGDGLSDALKVDPALLHLGDKVYVVLECEVSKIRLDPIKDTDALTRVHTLRAGTATMVDADMVQAQLAEQAERIALAKEAESGVSRMFDKGEDQLLAEHEEGDHADGLVDRCPECEAERAAEADEDDTPPTEPTPISGS
jgi:hypothetical protein